MKFCLVFLLAVLSSALLLPPPGNANSQPPRERGKARYVENQMLVKFRPEVEGGLDSPAMSDFVAKRHGARVQPLREPGRGAQYLIELDGSLSVEEAVRQASGDPRVEYAEPNYLLYPANTPNDALFGQQWGLYNTGFLGQGKPGSDIGATRAWDYTTGSDDIVVAIIDTGVDLAHVDLAPNAWVNRGERADNDVDDDNNGYVDDLNGWNFVSRSPAIFENPVADWHGTHVSGIIGAAGNNGIGVTGVAWRVKIMPLKFIGDKSGSTADVVKAINYAIDQKRRGVGVRVINASWGGPAESASLKSAIVAAGDAGILFVCAAGNGGNDESGDDVDATPEYPAAWSKEIPSIIAVAASDSADALTYFSNYGRATVQVAAPGYFVLSTTPGNQYGMGSGTSMATPHVSGIAALVFSRQPSLTPAQVRQRIISTADPVASLVSLVTSSGRANAYNAVTNTLQQAPPRPIVGAVYTNKKQVTVVGLGFVDESSVIEVNGAALSRMRYETSTAFPDGSITEISSKLGKSGMRDTFPSGATVTVTVYNPTTGERSAPFSYSKR
ncbi:MAG TPA: S8 family peptidase [Blastocatellia bacterium]|jgi:subtilisin family serine protease|nr:S8 family peptidase [Blastocatellia bacterium]